MEQALPGWRQFISSYGESPAARQVFARILSAEWSTLERYFNTPDEKRTPAMLRTLTTNRYVSVQRSGVGFHDYELGTLLCFFFLAADEPANIDLHPQLYSFLRHQGMSPLLANLTPTDQVSESQIVRKMVGKWLEASAGKHLNDRLAIQTSLLYHFHAEGRILSKRVLTNERSIVSSKTKAMESIVMRGDKSQMELIEPFLDDKTILGETAKRERQMRDVALTCLLMLNDFDVSELGVRVMRNSVYNAFDYSTVGFISDNDRERALKIYRDIKSARIAKPERAATRDRDTTD